MVTSQVCFKYKSDFFIKLCVCDNAVSVRWASCWVKSTNIGLVYVSFKMRLLAMLMNIYCAC